MGGWGSEQDASTEALKPSTGRHHPSARPRVGQAASLLPAPQRACTISSSCSQEDMTQSAPPSGCSCLCCERRVCRSAAAMCCTQANWAQGRGRACTVANTWRHVALRAVLCSLHTPRRPSCSSTQPSHPPPGTPPTTTHHDQVPELCARHRVATHVYAANELGCGQGGRDGQGSTWCSHHVQQTRGEGDVTAKPLPRCQRTMLP